MSYMDGKGLLPTGLLVIPGPASLIYTELFALILQLWEAIHLDIYIYTYIYIYTCCTMFLHSNVLTGKYVHMVWLKLYLQHRKPNLPTVEMEHWVS